MHQYTEPSKGDLSCDIIPEDDFPEIVPNMNPNYVNFRDYSKIPQQQQVQQKQKVNVTSINLSTLLQKSDPKQIAQDLVYNNGKQSKQQSKQYNYSRNSSHQQLQQTVSNRHLLNQSQETSKHNISSQQMLSKCPSQYTKASEDIKYQLERNPKSSLKNLITQKQLQYVSSARDYEKQHSLASTKSSKDLIDRLHSERHILNAKRNILADKVHEEQDKECTFRPKISKSYYQQNSNSNKQKHGDFYSNEMYLQGKKDRENLIKTQNQLEQEQKTLKEKPQISKKSNYLANNKNVQQGKPSNIVDRLYNSKQNNNQENDQQLFYDLQSDVNYVSKSKSLNKFNINNNTNHLKNQQKKRYNIATSNKYNVNQKLYDDAKRRKQEKQNTQNKSNSKTPTKAQVYNKVSKESNLLQFIKKFERDFQISCENQMRNPSQNYITYLEMVQILIELGFLKNEYNEDWVSPNPDSQSLVAQQIWLQLKGRPEELQQQSQQQEQIQQLQLALKRNLLIFLLAVQKVHDNKQYVLPVLNTQQEFNEKQMQLNTQYNPNVANTLNPDTDYSPHHQQLPQSFTSPMQQQQQQQIQQQYQTNNNNIDGQPEFQDQVQLTTEILQHNQQEIYNLLKDKPIFGYFDYDKNLYFQEQEIMPIYNYYHQLYLNRLAQNKPDYVMIEEEQQQQQISNISLQLAQHKKDKILQFYQSYNPDIQNIDHNQQLQYSIYKKQQTVEKIKQSLEDEEIQQCTFRPQTKDFASVSKQYESSRNQQQQTPSRSVKNNDYNTVNSSTDRKTSMYGSGVSRSIELYSLNKPFVQKRDRQKQEIEYEKECDECTFQPYLSPRINISLNKNGNKNVTKRSQEKEINRLKNARIQKEIKQQIKNNGETQNDNKISKVTTTVQKEFKKQSEEQQKSIKQYGPSTQFYHHRDANSPSFKIFQSEITMSDMNNSSQKNNINRYYENNNIMSPLSNNTNFENSPRNNIPPQNPQQNNYLGYSFGQPVAPDTSRTNNSQDEVKTGENTINNNQQHQISIHNVSPSQKSNVEEDKIPLLFVDVNIEEGKTARIIVFEGDKSDELADKFSQQYGLDQTMKSKLKDLLDQQINSLLTKIEEEENASEYES